MKDVTVQQLERAPETETVWIVADEEMADEIAIEDITPLASPAHITPVSAETLALAATLVEVNAGEKMLGTIAPPIGFAAMEALPAGVSDSDFNTRGHTPQPSASKSRYTISTPST